MKQLILICTIFTLSFSGLTQSTINGSITHDGIQRTFILYVPASYSGTTAVPLLFNFHGYTSNANDQMWYGDFRSIADTAGFIIVHPQGTLDGNGSTHFNVDWGGSATDDLGFTSALIDSLLLDYSIDQNRIYSTGMSNGGFMSFHLACNLSNRIAAIASVTGSIVPATLASCNATHPTPVLQIHGTSDGTVPYAGGAGWTEPVTSLMQYWANYNNCDAAPVVENLPNINTGDGSTVEKSTYVNGDACVEVIHFKVTGGDHTWPGSIFNAPGTNYDINASIEIWQFLSKYDLNGMINCVPASISENETENSFTIYPNPTNSVVRIQGNLINPVAYEIYSLLGKKMMNGSISVENQTIDIAQLSADIYILKINNRIFKIIKTE